MRHLEHRVRIKCGLLETVHRLAIRFAGDDLDDPPGEDEPGVVVREVSAHGRQLRNPGHLLVDKPCNRVWSIAGVRNGVAPPAAGVCQQVAHGHVGRHFRVGDAKLGQVRSLWSIEVHSPCSTSRINAVAVNVLVMDPI
jgi:hypothetical protein